jgi:hypothetical protein
LVCGHEAHDVGVALVAWRQPLGREQFSAIPRCRDREACRSRLEAIGDEWPVDDGSAPTLRPVTVLPEPEPEPASAEAPSWL